MEKNILLQLAPSMNIPDTLPVSIDTNQFLKELTKAYFRLGKLTLQKALVHEIYLAAPLFVREAQKSSKIEGTASTVKDVYLNQIGELTKNITNTQRVNNYLDAIIHGMKELNRKPLTCNLVKNLHRILLSKTDEENYPGEYRQWPVYVKANNKIVYTPPKYEDIDKYMQNLEFYIHDETYDPLIQAALMHYQLVAIHPFDDGNGRMARMLIPLFLYYKKILSVPTFYISGYFEKNVVDYRKQLELVDKTKKYESWIKYFLSALVEQADINQSFINKINKLYDDTLEKIDKNMRKSPYMNRVLQAIFETPFFKPTNIYKKVSNADPKTIYRLIKKLEKFGIIKSFTEKKQRNKVYSFPELINLVEEMENELLWGYGN